MRYFLKRVTVTMYDLFHILKEGFENIIGGGGDLKIKNVPIVFLYG